MGRVKRSYHKTADAGRFWQPTLAAVAAASIGRSSRNEVRAGRSYGRHIDRNCMRRGAVAGVGKDADRCWVNNSRRARSATKKGPEHRRGLSSPCRGTSALRSRSLLVHALAQRDAVEFGVRSLFLVEVCRQQPDDVVMAQFFRPSCEGAVAGNLIMLDGLGIGQDGRIQDGLVFDFACCRVGLLDQAIDGRAVGAFRLFSELREALSRRSIWFCVSITCDLRPAFKSALVAKSAIFGMAFVSRCSA
jgi:hypothetical protein